MKSILIIAALFIAQYYAFTIPLPFGGINIDKNERGETSVDTFSNLNFFGYGANTGLKVKGGNGGLTLEPRNEILVKNKNYGVNSTFGFEKQKGIAIDSDVSAGDNTFHGGLGKENRFINEIGQAAQQKAAQRKPLPPSVGTTQ
ncbi:unnamed protein product [Bursaphelenchus xylophilus]|uniref:(pine wood nematode) hypothetical protein n=1 Tax=Bursaphelenchus xylophilus TaxID=6326 RepID=A0A1I7RMS3_BURXY|nr:unnamed protein product [Bursaphelenchus xylophilus]CAG9125524.1 unnamed protein product [Bursaphelenchus xylophilus]